MQTLPVVIVPSGASGHADDVGRMDAATLLLAVTMGENLIATLRLLTVPAASAPGVDVRVMDIARVDPKATWRVVRDARADQDLDRQLLGAVLALREDLPAPG